MIGTGDWKGAPSNFLGGGGKSGAKPNFLYWFNTEQTETQ